MDGLRDYDIMQASRVTVLRSTVLRALPGRKGVRRVKGRTSTHLAVIILYHNDPSFSLTITITTSFLPCLVTSPHT